VTGWPWYRSTTFVGGERAAAKELAKRVAEVEAGEFDRSRRDVHEPLVEQLANRRPSLRRPSDSD